MQRFDFTIIDKPRKEKFATNFLSRLTIFAYEDKADDHFLDEQMFSISTYTP